MSRLISTLMNAVPRMVLASPAHRLMSNRYATLHFRGRKTGRGYHVPVAYVTCDGGIAISTDSGWWHNIAHGEPLTVTFRGRRRHASATRLDPAASLSALRELVEIPGYATTAGVPREGGRVSETALAQAAAERVVLSVDLGQQR